MKYLIKLNELENADVLTHSEYSKRYDEILSLWRKENPNTPPPPPPNRTIKIGLFGRQS